MLSAFATVTIMAVALFYTVIIHTKNRTLILPEDVHTVYFGNSMIECAVNDTMIPGCYNFARSAEHIEFIYSKIQLLKTHNPNFNNAVIGLDDIILVKNFSESFNHLPNNPLYYSTISLDDVRDNVRHFSFKWNTSYLSHPFDIIKIRPMLESFFHPSSPKSLGIGGYLRLSHSITVSPDDSTASDRQQPVTPAPKFNQAIINYFNKINTYCKDHGINVTYISTPRYGYNRGDTLFREFHRIYLNQYLLHDFSTITLPDSCFGDQIHLNRHGADIFTKIMADSIR